MMDSFDGKTAVVTGAVSGIGRALATQLLHAGARVVLADFARSALDAAATAVATYDASQTEPSIHRRADTGARSELPGAGL